MLDNNTMVGGQTEDIELESTSFIIDDTEQESYRGEDDKYASNGIGNKEIFWYSQAPQYWYQTMKISLT